MNAVNLVELDRRLEQAYLQAQQAGLLVMTDEAGIVELTAAVGAHRDGEIFLADPLRNLVLRYPAGTAMRDIHKDLLRLLKLASEVLAG